MQVHEHVQVLAGAVVELDDPDAVGAPERGAEQPAGFAQKGVAVDEALGAGGKLVALSERRPTQRPTVEVGEGLDDELDA